MEKKNLVALINKGYTASKDLEISTRSIIEGYGIQGKGFLDWTLADLGETGINNPILKGYVTDCLTYGLWRTKRQLDSTKKSEEAAGWKNIKERSESILKLESNNRLALDMLKASVMFNRISTMISTRRGELKKLIPVVVATTTGNKELVPEPTGTVRDARQEILSAIATKLATSREGYTVVAYEKLVADIAKLVAKVAKATKATDKDKANEDKKDATKVAKATKVGETKVEITA